MERHLLVACLVYLALAVQPSVPNDIASAGLQPWLPGIVLVITAIVIDGAASLIWAGLLGLGVDCLSIDRLGVHVVVATVVGFGVMIARDESKSPGSLMIGLLTFGGTFTWKILAATIHGFVDHRQFDPASMSLRAFTSAVSSAGLVLGILLLQRLLLCVVQRKRDSTYVLANRWSMLTGK